MDRFNHLTDQTNNLHASNSIEGLSNTQNNTFSSMHEGLGGPDHDHSGVAKGVWDNQQHNPVQVSVVSPPPTVMPGRVNHVTSPNPHMSRTTSANSPRSAPSPHAPTSDQSTARPFASPAPLKSSDPSVTSALGGNTMDNLSTASYPETSTTGTFSLTVPSTFSDMLGHGSMTVGTNPSPFTPPLSNGNIPHASQPNGSVHNFSPRPQPSPSQSPNNNRKDNHSVKDSRVNGEIGAASGLYMLSQSHGDSKSKHDEEKSLEGLSPESNKRKHDALQNGNTNGSVTTLPGLDVHSFGEPEDPIPKRGTKGVEKDDGHSDNETDNDSKRKSFLERNRQAAFKCRQRKKAWLASLQAKVEYLQSDNESLQNTVEALRAEVLFLKSQLMQQHQSPGQIDGDAKETHGESNRQMPASYSLNVNPTNGFVGYPTATSVSHPLMTNMPPVSQVSAHQPGPSMPSVGLDNAISNVPQSVSMSPYGAPGVPRLTQIPATQPLLSPYTHSSTAYASARDAE